ncbi:MAG: helix-turn-helix domain-containing protein [Candidatus Nanopelagicales bacterium]
MQQTTADDTRLWTLAETAEYLSLSRSALYRWRLTGEGPTGIRVGSVVRYRPSTVKAWVEEQEAQDRH